MNAGPIGAHDASASSAQLVKHKKARTLTYDSPSVQGPGAPAVPIGAHCPPEDIIQKERRPKAPPPTCVRRSGLCLLTGWAISEYCPACHG